MPRHRGHHPIQSHHPSQPEPSRQTFTHRQLTWGCFPKNHQDGQLKVTVTSGFLRNWNSSNCTTPPPFSISFLLKPLSQLPGVVTRSGSRHTTSGFLVNKNKAGFKQTKRSSPKWHFEGLKGYIYKTCPIRSPACRFFDTTKSFSEFCEGAWHFSKNRSETVKQTSSPSRKPRLDGRWDEFNKLPQQKKNINRLPQMWYVRLSRVFFRGEWYFTTFSRESLDWVYKAYYWVYEPY